PGYGASDPNPEASFINWSKDLIQLADYLNIKKFSLTGYAMGGQYALACAHQVPERLKQVALISAGMPAETAEDYEQMVPLYKMNARLARYLPKVYKLLSSVLVKGVLSDPEKFFTELSEKLDKADQEVMSGEDFKINMFASLQEGFKQGGKATSRDIIQLMQDWEFKLDGIKVKFDIWHGGCDHHVPHVLSEKFRPLLVNSKYHKLAGYGHYMFYTHWSDILDELLKDR
ncbi:MAG: alpha/beta hydrolase, partial [Gammaproteobacteria bacterium]|nr:alpha/beta hydrolase [Gammaproteobacteria bacterium]